jgi:hypothetical protein|tara:strand:+ start:284 stop:484 length:201 start_codon:yes stop_codon:yes gene_type:complete
MSDKITKMPDTKKPALEVEDVTSDMIAQNEAALNERLAQLIANDPTASRIQGRLEVLRGLNAQLNS